MDVVMLLYPRFQQLDLTGPFEVLARFRGVKDSSGLENTPTRLTM